MYILHLSLHDEVHAWIVMSTNSMVRIEVPLGLGDQHSLAAFQQANPATAGGHYLQSIGRAVAEEPPFGAGGP